jgi:Toprim domain
LCSLGTGNLKNLDLQGEDVVLLADWDGGYDKPAWQALQKAQEILQQKNIHVSLILPCENPELTKEKLDFNDALIQEGLSSLKALLMKQGLEGEPLMLSSRKTIRTSMIKPIKPKLIPETARNSKITLPSLNKNTLLMLSLTQPQSKSLSSRKTFLKKLLRLLLTRNR